MTAVEFIAWCLGGAFVGWTVGAIIALGGKS